MADNFPAIIPTSVSFGLRSNTQVFKSPFTSSTQTIRMPGAAWFGRATFDDLEQEEWRELAAFLAEMEGMNGRFYFTDFGGTSPRGGMATRSNTVRVRGGGQTGNTLAIDGLPANLSTAFKKGDYISFDTSAGREMHIVTADANANSSGQTTLNISPQIRVSPSDNAIVAYRSNVDNGVSNADISCIVRLSSDDVMWGLQAPVTGSISFSFVETFA